MGCQIWIQETNQDAVGGLDITRFQRLGQKITISNKTICQLEFYLKKTGSPTGTLTCTIRKQSDDSIIETSGVTLDVSTLTTSFQWFAFTFNSLVNEAVYLLVEFYGGDVNNLVVAGDYNGTTILGNLCGYKTVGGWSSWPTYEETIKIYEFVSAAKPVSGSIVPIMKILDMI